jgi:hypothetical protein
MMGMSRSTSLAHGRLDFQRPSPQNDPMTLLIHFSVPGRSGLGVLIDLVNENSIVDIPGNALTRASIDEIKGLVREEHRDAIVQACCKDDGLNFFGKRKPDSVIDLSRVQIIIRNIIHLQY